MDFAEAIDRYPDFPVPGVVYFDVAPLHMDPRSWTAAVERLSTLTADMEVDAIAAIEAKGFIVGTTLATARGVPLVPVRKPGLTPGPVERIGFEKEYGRGEYELRAGAFAPGARVLIAYDILAGPGATAAAGELVERCGASVAGAVFLVELAWLRGRELLPYRVESLVRVES